MPDLPPTEPHRTAGGSVSPAYFARLYASDPDPWGFATSPYEAAKYAATLEALPRPHYRRAFEVGCAGGVLTRQLASRCGHLVAVDVAPDALEAARARCADLGGVLVAPMTVPNEWPVGLFDLVVVSEVGYYLGDADFASLQARCADTVEPGGHLVLVHWTGSTDYPRTGDAVHDAVLADPAWDGIYATRTEAYRLDVLARRAHRPV